MHGEALTGRAVMEYEEERGRGGKEEAQDECRANSRTEGCVSYPRSPSLPLLTPLNRFNGIRSPQDDGHELP